MTPPRQQMPTRLVGGTPFAVTTYQDALQHIISGATSQVPQSVRFANAYCVALASRSDDYARCLRTFGVNFPDGMPVKWALNLWESPRSAHRVRGPSVFFDILSMSNSSLSHYFVGGDPNSEPDLTSSLRAKFPLADIRGHYSPPFAALTDDYLGAIATAVVNSGANTIWIGLGTPKQDFVSSYLANDVGSFALGVGAAFDFALGTVRQAPKWLQRSGLEWLFRLGSEPRRLWRRYLFGNARFVSLVLRDNVMRRTASTRSRKWWSG